MILFFQEQYFSIFLTKKKALMTSFVPSQHGGQDGLRSQICNVQIAGLTEKETVFIIINFSLILFLSYP